MKADVRDMHSKLDSMAAMPDDLSAIKERLENPPTAIPEKPTEAPIDKRLTALNYIRSYDDEARRASLRFDEQSRSNAGPTR